MSGVEDNRGKPEWCERIRSMLDDWLDGLLEGEAACFVKTHLADCPVCAAWFERHKAISMNLAVLGRAADQIASSPGRSAKQSGDLGEAAAGGVRRLIRWRSWTAVAALMVMFVGASLYLIMPRHPAGTDPDSHDRTHPVATSSPKHEAGRPAPMVLADSDNTFNVACPEGRMAVPIESNNPRIHIVWFYDQLSPAAAEERQSLPEPANENQLQGDDR